MTKTSSTPVLSLNNFKNIKIGWRKSHVHLLVVPPVLRLTLHKYGTINVYTLLEHCHHHLIFVSVKRSVGYIVRCIIFWVWWSSMFEYRTRTVYSQHVSPVASLYVVCYWVLRWMRTDPSPRT